MTNATFEKFREDNFSDLENWARLHPSPVNEADGEGWTALHHLARAEGERKIDAVMAGHLAGILLAAGADPHRPNNSGETPFNIAAPASPVIGRLMTNHWLERALRGEGRGLNETSGSHRSTLAQYIAKWSNDEEIDEQLNSAQKMGMNIAVQNASGWTPLHAAAAMGRVKAVEAFASRYTDEQKSLRTTEKYTAAYSVEFPAGATASEIAQACLDQDRNLSPELRERLERCQSAIRFKPSVAAGRKISAGRTA